MNYATADRSQQFSKPSLALPIILIILGVLAMSLPMVMSVGVIRLLAWLIIFDGVAQLFFAFQTEGVGRVSWKLLVSLLYIGGGIYLIARPLAGLTALTLALAVFFCAEGVIDVFAYIFTRRSDGSPWLLLHGIVTLFLGLMIWKQWPLSSFWVIGTLVGVSMLLTGVTRLMMALEVRKLIAARGSQLPPVRRAA
jgi:uncharacterized membrane protein HdeD (DUF308 family)